MEGIDRICNEISKLRSEFDVLFSDHPEVYITNVKLPFIIKISNSELEDSIAKKLGLKWVSIHGRNLLIHR